MGSRRSQRVNRSLSQSSSQDLGSQSSRKSTQKQQNETQSQNNNNNNTQNELSQAEDTYMTPTDDFEDEDNPMNTSGVAAGIMVEEGDGSEESRASNVHLQKNPSHVPLLRGSKIDSNEILLIHVESGSQQTIRKPSSLQQLTWEAARTFSISPSDIILRDLNDTPAENIEFNNLEAVLVTCQGSDTQSSQSLNHANQKFSIEADIVPHVNILIHGGDEYDFFTALSELVDNSIQNTAGNTGRRIIKVDVDPKKAILNLWDNGRGMNLKGLKLWATLGISAPPEESNDNQLPYMSSRAREIHLTSDFSRYGVGSKKAIFNLGDEVTMTTKPRESRYVYQCTLSRQQLENEYERNSSQQWKTSFDIRPPKPDELADTEGSFTCVTISKMKPLYQQNYNWERLCREMNHVYHYYIFGPLGNSNSNTTATRTNTNTTAAGNTTPLASSSKKNRRRSSTTPGSPTLDDSNEFEDSTDHLEGEDRLIEFYVDGKPIQTCPRPDMETMLLRRGVNPLPLQFRVQARPDAGRLAGMGGTGENGHSNVGHLVSGVRVVLFYFPFRNGVETLPVPFHSDRVDSTAMDSVPLSDRDPGLEVFWNARLLSAERIRGLGFMRRDWKKRAEDPPDHCYRRVKGMLFLDSNFEVSSNKMYLCRQTPLVQSLLEYSERKFKTQFKSWVKQCHNTFDEEIVFEQLDEDFASKGDQTYYQSIKLAGQRYSKGDHIITQSKPRAIGTIRSIFRDASSESYGCSVSVDEWNPSEKETNMIIPVTRIRGRLSKDQFKQEKERQRSANPAGIKIIPTESVPKQQAMPPNDPVDAGTRLPWLTVSLVNAQGTPVRKNNSGMTMRVTHSNRPHWVHELRSKEPYKRSMHSFCISGLVTERAGFTWAGVYQFHFTSDLPHIEPLDYYLTVRSGAAATVQFVRDTSLPSVLRIGASVPNMAFRVCDEYGNAVFVDKNRVKNIKMVCEGTDVKLKAKHVECVADDDNDHDGNQTAAVDMDVDRPSDNTTQEKEEEEEEEEGAGANNKTNPSSISRSHTSAVDISQTQDSGNIGKPYIIVFQNVRVTRAKLPSTVTTPEQGADHDEGNQAEELGYLKDVPVQLIIRNRDPPVSVGRVSVFPGPPHTLHFDEATADVLSRKVGNRQVLPDLHIAATDRAGNSCRPNGDDTSICTLQSSEIDIGEMRSRLNEDGCFVFSEVRVQCPKDHDVCHLRFQVSGTGSSAVSLEHDLGILRLAVSLKPHTDQKGMLRESGGQRSLIDTGVGEKLENWQLVIDKSTGDDGGCEQGGGRVQVSWSDDEVPIDADTATAILPPLPAPTKPRTTEHTADILLPEVSFKYRVDVRTNKGKAAMIRVVNPDNLPRQVRVYERVDIPFEILDSFQNRISPEEDPASCLEGIEPVIDVTRPTSEGSTIEQVDSERCRVIWDQEAGHHVCQGLVVSGQVGAFTVVIGTQRGESVDQVTPTTLQMTLQEGEPAALRVNRFEESTINVPNYGTLNSVAVSVHDKAGNIVLHREVQIDFNYGSGMVLKTLMEEEQNIALAFDADGYLKTPEMLVCATEPGTHTVEISAHGMGLTSAKLHLNIVAGKHPVRLLPQINGEEKDRLRIEAGEEVPDVGVQVIGEDGGVLKAPAEIELVLSIPNGEQRIIPSSGIGKHDMIYRFPDLHSCLHVAGNYIAEFRLSLRNLHYASLLAEDCRTLSCRLHMEVVPGSPHYIEFQSPEFELPAVSNAGQSSKRVLWEHTVINVVDAYRNLASTYSGKAIVKIDKSDDDNNTDGDDDNDDDVNDDDDDDDNRSLKLEGSTKVSCAAGRAVFDRVWISRGGKPGHHHVVFQLHDLPHVSRRLSFYLSDDKHKQATFNRLKKKQKKIVKELRRREDAINSAQHRVDEQKTTEQRLNEELVALKERVSRSVKNVDWKNMDINKIQQLIHAVKKKITQKSQKNRREPKFHAEGGIKRMLQSMHKDGEASGVVGVVAELGAVEDEKLDEVISQRLGSTMNVVVVRNSEAASQWKERLSSESDTTALLPLDGVTRVTLTDNNRVRERALENLPDAVRRDGYFGYAANLVEFPSHDSAAMLRPVFASLLGDTLVFDTFEHAKQFRLDAVRAGRDVPVIICKDGEKIERVGIMYAGKTKSRVPYRFGQLPASESKEVKQYKRIQEFLSEYIDAKQSYDDAYQALEEAQEDLDHAREEHSEELKQLKEQHETINTELLNLYGSQDAPMSQEHTTSLSQSSSLSSASRRSKKRKRSSIISDEEENESENENNNDNDNDNDNDDNSSMPLSLSQDIDPPPSKKSRKKKSRR